VETLPGMGPYHVNADRVTFWGTDRPWIYASGYRGLTRATLTLEPARALVSLPAAAGPTIDGKLDDPCWDGKEPVAFPSRDRILLRHDGEAVYVAFRRPARFRRDGTQYAWKKTAKGDDGAVWKDDSCEVLLADERKTGYVHMGVSASGARYDARCVYAAGKAEDKAWNGPWQAAVLADDKAFVVEMAIPFRTLAAAGLDRAALTLNVRTRGSELLGPGRDGWSRCRQFCPLGLGSPRRSAPRTYTVRLHFAELDDVAPGGRVFDVKLQGKTVLRDFDVLQAVFPRNHVVIREFKGIEAGDTLTLEMVPRAKNPTAATAPILSGIQVLETPGR
jgi:hypothetical protein